MLCVSVTSLYLLLFYICFCFLSTNPEIDWEERLQMTDFWAHSMGP